MKVHILVNLMLQIRPKVIPNKYNDINKKINGIPSFKTETPNKGIAIKTAGTKPIKVLNIAVKVNE